MPKEFILENIDMSPFMTAYNTPFAIICRQKEYYHLSLRVITPNRQHVFKNHLMGWTHLLVMNCENLPPTKIGIDITNAGLISVIR